MTHLEGRLALVVRDYNIAFVSKNFAKEDNSQWWELANLHFFQVFFE
jgi:hypothetical protein